MHQYVNASIPEYINMLMVPVNACLELHIYQLTCRMFHIPGNHDTQKQITFLVVQVNVFREHVKISTLDENVNRLTFEPDPPPPPPKC